MTNPIRAWDAFWFRPTSARPLSAFRIAVGLITLSHLALLTYDLDYWLSDQGVLTGLEIREIAGPLRLSPLNWAGDPITVRAFVGATAVVAVLFTVGWRTRLSAALLYAAVLSIHHRNVLTNCGADNLLIALLFYLMLSPSGAAYSVDAWREFRRRGTVAEPLIVPWAQRLVQLQLALIYFNTAVLKCHGRTWLDGTAMHFVLTLPEVGRFDASWLCRYPAALNLLTHGALLLEFAMPFLLWFRATRGWMIASGLVLHGGVFYVLNVPLFGALMTACYLTFLDPDEFDALFAWVNPKVWARRVRSVPGRTPIDRVDPAAPATGPHPSPGAAATHADGPVTRESPLPHRGFRESTTE